jgi:hypothetical protein
MRQPGSEHAGSHSNARGEDSKSMVPLRQFEAGGDPDRVGSGLPASPVRGHAVATMAMTRFCAPGVDGAHEKGGVEAKSAGSAAAT